MPLKGLTPGISLASFPSPIPPISVGSNIKSIQRIAVSIANGATTANVTISKVDRTKSIVRVLGSAESAVGASNPAEECGAAQFIDDVTVQAIRVGNQNVLELQLEIIEYISVKSKQTGTTSTSTTLFARVTATISTVNPLKSTLNFSFTNTETTNNVYTMLLNGNITSSTQLSFLAIGGAAKTVYWDVVEFY